MFNKAARKLGDNYMVSEYENFYEENNSDIENRPGKDYQGQTREHKTYLYNKNGEIRIGTENYRGDVKNLVRGVDDLGPVSPNSVSDLHTHPNAGKSAGFGKTWSHAPSGNDDVPPLLQNNYYHVIVSPTQIWLHGNKSSQIKKLERGKIFNK